MASPITAFEEGCHNEMRQLSRDLDICNSSEHVKNALWPTPLIPNLRKAFSDSAPVSLGRAHQRLVSRRSTVGGNFL